MSYDRLQEHRSASFLRSCIFWSSAFVERASSAFILIRLCTFLRSTGLNETVLRAKRNGTSTAQIPRRYLPPTHMVIAI